MRRASLGSPLIPASFLLATLAASPAFARDSIDEIAAQIFGQLQDIRPLHLFAAACVFLVIGIFAKAREASGFIIFGSFFLTALCVGAFLIFALTGDMMSRRRHRIPRTEAPAVATTKPEAAAEKAPEVVNANAQPGDKCRKNSDCGAGTVCAKVAGNRNCWAPCTPQGQCDPGFACMAAASKEMVCVQ